MREQRQQAGLYVPGRLAGELREATRKIAAQTQVKHPFQQYLADLDLREALGRVFLVRRE
jgi:hypothetical protein